MAKKLEPPKKADAEFSSLAHEVRCLSLVFSIFFLTVRPPPPPVLAHSVAWPAVGGDLHVLAYCTHSQYGAMDDLLSFVGWLVVVSPQRSVNLASATLRLLCAFVF